MTVIKLCTHCVASEAQLLAFDIKYPESVEVPSQLKLTRGDQLHVVAGEDCYQCGKQCDTCDEEWNDTHTYDDPGVEETLDTLYDIMSSDTPQQEIEDANYLAYLRLKYQLKE